VVLQLRTDGEDEDAEALSYAMAPRSKNEASRRELGCGASSARELETSIATLFLELDIGEKDVCHCATSAVYSEAGSSALEDGSFCCIPASRASNDAKSLKDEVSMVVRMRDLNRYSQHCGVIEGVQIGRYIGGEGKLLVEDGGKPVMGGQ
jgi:hypothetical protein